jgi:FKBP-type peptidyl-prolyl cis-trans isomerase FkpA
MRFLTAVTLLALSTPLSWAAQEPEGKKVPAQRPAEPALATDEEKTVYALGLAVWQNLVPLDLSPAEVEIVKRAIGDAAAGKPKLPLEEYRPKLSAFGEARGKRTVEKEKARSRAFIESAARETGAVKTASGLVFSELQAGTGESPKATDRVKVHYRGTLINGTEFDSSYKRQQPAEFPLGGVIPCWTEGLQKMKVGGKARLVCPSEIAYGDRGRPSIPGGAALVFEIELLGISPPADAKPKP